MSEAPRLTPASPGSAATPAQPAGSPQSPSRIGGRTPAQSAGPIADRFGSGPEQPRMSMRHRLARLGARQPQAAVLDPLFRVIRANHPKADTAVVERAYRTAEHYHRGQLRKSGDPYITHPLAVATILAELGMTETTLCAALLHDTVEDTSYTIEQLTADFGQEVAVMVDGVTKLDKIAYGDSAQAETIRKMVIAMARDIRVVVIKLADRLHNMRTLHFLRPDKQTRIARDTLDIFAPLAHRLGMNAVKWELEDLSFAIMQPKIYAEIVQLVAERAPQREAFLRKVTEQVTADLKAARIRATVHGRPKHYYSIYQKMVVRGRDFSDIYDLVGLRILVDTDKDCYAALGVMHVRWNPLPGRFKDYIAIPKFNMYQSLHTTVIGPEGKPVELQIRTHDMHRRAEYGVAAHWKYKENARGTAPASKDGSDLSWLRSLNDWQKETSDPEEFLESLRYEINSGEVFVYTPKGDVITLPAGATPVDFAYAIHTEVGQRCIGARVNGRLVPLESELNNGDVVDVMTSKAEGAGPSRDWLEFVKSPKARNKIRHYFTRERREESIERGREALAKQVRKAGLPLQRFLTVQHLTEVAAYFRLADVSALYAAIGENNVSAQAVVQRLIVIEGGQESAVEEAAEDRPLTGRRRRGSSAVSGPGVAVAGDTDMWVKLAKCCTPVPGDEIMGFITRGNGVSVHRTDCTNAASLEAHPERMVEVSWAPTAESSYLVAVQVEGLDRQGMLSDVTRVVSDHHVNILSASVNTTRSRVFKARLTFETPDPTHLDALVQAIRQVPGVFDVFRVKQ
ncbi:bifunctional (p)ppGpp synthetase/guanosine-3',5'-bis(diphosphate) 3'-pyrophosphohydrolase [Enemella dayhoffiae]|uniref:Bifunctional (P)ppGpp synthetase/guanosine-3',5'-bis(Diphosphate) 3'-pyrophosphohydrolase n=2 Tax=Enemella dayhoffiae TaxID=2016507 RepID=A0A255HA28_9ACTN|nr:bifunctional (p)ppGpp synthetase/guanosine-3',5'-bis(diphosphate) 3'-pyrophosphohydrolase [Enemella dayhoffiae]